MNRDFILAFSGGKDSILALYKMLHAGFTPKAIFTIIDESTLDNKWHCLSVDILNAVSNSLEIPIDYFVRKSTDIYQDVYPNFLKQFKTKGIPYCVFGDIFLESIRKQNEYFCHKAGLKPLFPLWNMSEEEVFTQFINAGFKGIIKSVFPYKIPEDFLGNQLDQDLVEKLKKLDVNICGEYGEYHTFVYDGPFFKDPINFSLGEIYDNSLYKSLIISI